MPVNAVIYGVSGPRLTKSEARFFADINPWGFILFARNIEGPLQVRALTAALRDCVGRDCFIFIDQEGGRVQRLRPPHWMNYPALATYGRIYDKDQEVAERGVYLHHRLIADDLRRLGIDADCAPVLDIPTEEADPIISDRAFSHDPRAVIDMAHAAMAGLMEGGVVPVIKHIPGHGRAKVDSHKDLPIIQSSHADMQGQDFLPFRTLRHAPMAMTAHAVYDCIDKNHPATLSNQLISTLIRDEFGFDGLLMSDDLDMKALSGELSLRAGKALAAGCDVVLHCSGDMKAMVTVASGINAMTPKAEQRAHIAQFCREDAHPCDRKMITQEFAKLLSDWKLKDEAKDEVLAS